MPETNSSSGSPVESLIADCRLSRKRLQESPPTSVTDMVRELRNNVYPMFVAVLEQIAEVDDVIQEVVEQQDSFIEPELAEQILTTIAAGAALIVEVKAILPELDDLRIKKISTIIQAFEKAAELTYMGVQDAAALEEREDEDDEDENEDDEDENEDGENEDGENEEEKVPDPQ